jgi:hypothetical protein
VAGKALSICLTGATGLTGATTTALTLVVLPPGTASDLTPSEIDPLEAAVTNLVTSPEPKLVLMLLSAEPIEVGVAGVLGALGVVPGTVALIFETAALSCSTTLP